MSKLADYGTVVMTYMALEPERIHSAGEVAARIGVALPTVSKILKLLARDGLVVSQRGVKGGYSLSRPPREISMAEIIGAVEGAPVGLTECSTTPGMCTQEATCTIRGNWQRINQAIRTALDSVTLAEMIEPAPQPVHLDAVRSRPMKRVYGIQS